MKNLSKLKVLCLLLSITSIFFTSCEKEESLDHQEEVKLDFTVTPQINVLSVENGTLVFTDFLDFRNTMAALSEMNHEQRIQWEESLNFVSMQSIYENAISEVIEGGMYTITPFIQENLDNGVLRSKFLPAIETEVFELNLFDASFGVVLGQEATVRIGNNIIKFASESITFSVDGISQTFMVNSDITLRGTSQWNDFCQQKGMTEYLEVEGLFYSIATTGGGTMSSPIGGQLGLNLLITNHTITVRYFVRFGGQWLPGSINASLVGNTECSYTLIYPNNNGSSGGKSIQFKEQNNYQEKLTGFGEVTHYCVDHGFKYAPTGTTFAGPMELESADWQVELGNGMTCSLEF